MNDLDALPARYRLVLCDLWGCVHDGYRLLPGAENRLKRWRTEGRKTLFVTNAPRSAATTGRQLDAMKLDPMLYDGIVSAGEVGIAALKGRAVGFCGTAADRADLVEAGLELTDKGYRELACAGLQSHETVDDYAERLDEWRRNDVLLHCLNPDRVVDHGGRRVVCAGALADAYEAMGGRTVWHGKPFASTYDHALDLAGGPPRHAVVAIGDGLKTDVLGAASYGIDCVYVAGGIHDGEPYPADLTPGWRPLMTVDSL
ncbi:HAD hydrolase-like protein [Sphingomonas sp. BN140010]|uniref:HAD hydrolase-like protein n=1 Tax=Sphingomonas arvum TaxID=2992113 RepID=A0ABT3JDX7_9SPHN|nr:HAD hydrolase-like protein [Sphingomonas sp. BN140010]MCW3797267.1 HAD hydrolase-like protein [Sphingomonas sp. BN140010]